MDGIKTWISFQYFSYFFSDFPFKSPGGNDPKGIHPRGHGGHGFLPFMEEFRNQEGHMPGFEDSLVSGGVDEEPLVPPGNIMGKKKRQNG